jgi:hypothetical protein
MTGFDIRNAMNKAYGISSVPEHDERSVIDATDGVSRIQHILVVLTVAMRGWGA